MADYLRPSNTHGIRGSSKLGFQGGAMDANICGHPRAFPHPLQFPSRSRKPSRSANALTGSICLDSVQHIIVDWYRSIFAFTQLPSRQERILFLIDLADWSYPLKDGLYAIQTYIGDAIIVSPLAIGSPASTHVTSSPNTKICPFFTLSFESNHHS
jgi:hypothetical protein